MDSEIKKDRIEHETMAIGQNYQNIYFPQYDPNT